MVEGGEEGEVVLIISPGPGHGPGPGSFVARVLVLLESVYRGSS